MTRVLLVTGARSLADDRAAEAWARGVIAEALRGVDLLIVGDAPGPDAWATDLATMRLGCRLMRSAERYVTRGRNAGCIEIDTGRGDVDIVRWTNHSTHPLRRNKMMVAAMEGYRDHGADVRVLALLDGRKPAVVKPGEKRPTRGTEHTVGLARKAGLTVTERTWPRDAAKGGV